MSAEEQQWERFWAVYFCPILFLAPHLPAPSSPPPCWFVMGRSAPHTHRAGSCGHISMWRDAALPIPTGLVHVVTSVCFHMCMYIGAASDVYSGHAWGIAHAQHVLRPWTRGNADVCVCVCVCVCARAREYACICIYSFSTSSHAHLTCDMSL